MRHSDRVKLHFGPYHSPRYRVGEVAQCESHGEVVIVATSKGRIPWPVCKKGRGTKSLVLYEGLLRAIERESGQAVCHWWGVGVNLVTKWRRLLGVPLSTGMPGMVVTVAVKSGDTVEKGQKLLSLEAMKMETTMVSDRNGVVKEVFVKPGSRVANGDLLVTFQ